jgi:hypothetical protein
MSFICEGCKKPFTSKQRLDYHRKQNVCKLKQDLSCLVCKKSFTSKQRLDYHNQNGVCLTPSPTVSQDVMNVVLQLSNRLTALENENRLLNERVKQLESIKAEREEVDSFDMLYRERIRRITVKEKKQLVFKYNEDRYAVMKCREKDKDEEVISIFARIEEDEYERLTENDVISLGRVLESYKVSEKKIKIDTGIYEKCMKHISVRDSITKPEKCDINFFVKGDDGKEYFKGTTFKRGSMEEYREIYKKEGEKVLLENAPQRFLNLWEGSREDVMNYFIS